MKVALRIILRVALFPLFALGVVAGFALFALSYGLGVTEFLIDEIF
jgi:hypothetical protein